MSTQNLIELDGGSFAETIGSSTPTLVDFWAPWCGPCRALGPTIDRLAADFDGKANVGKVNIDDHPAIAAQFGVASIPTVIVFRDGKPVDQFVGIRPYEDYAAALQG